jgi:thaumarchaeosortase
VVHDDLCIVYTERREETAGSVINANMVKIFSHLESSWGNVKAIRMILMKILPIIALIPPFLILYSLDPASFEKTLEGRTFYLFFVWLVFLEVIMNWDKVQESKISKARSPRTAAFIAVLLLPTIYIIVANYFGMNDAIVSWATLVAHYFELSTANLGLVPLSTEYLVLTVLFASTISLSFGLGHLKDFALSTLFLGAMGLVYSINNFYPYGLFTPFQIPVPITTQLAAGVLNLMGYSTSISQTSDSNYGWISSLSVTNPKEPFKLNSNPISLGVAWPCAGVESLIIYTITILIFLKASNLSWKRGTIYFAIGAIVTYFINVLRIVTIFTLAMQYGWPSPQASEFHDYFGQLYSITWIMFYPLIIIGSQHLLSKFKAGTNGRSLRDKISPDVTI